MNVLLYMALLVLSVNIIFSLIRGVMGPTPGDRLLAINMIGTKTIVLLGILAVLIGELSLVDVMLVYGLINFVGSIFIGRQIGNVGSRRKECMDDN